jgi:hypothetical protein
VPALPPDLAQRKAPPAVGDQLPLAAFDDGNDARPASRNRWAWLLAHVFRADLDTCIRCGGPMRWLDAALTQPAIAMLLAAHRLGPGPPAHVRRPIPDQLTLPFAR